MKESISKDGTIRREWTFDDWANGNSPVTFGALTTDSEGQKRIDTISDSDFEKLRQEQLRSYKEAVEKAFEAKKNHWTRKLQRTKDSNSALNKEIASQEKQIKKPGFNTKQRGLHQYWKEYDKIIVEGIDGSKFHHPNHNNYSPNARKFIEVEAIKLYLDFLKNPKQNKGTKEPISFQWKTNPEKQLPMLFKLMKDTYNLIDQGTTQEQFKAVFTGQPIVGVKPIKWSESNRLLAYFLDSAFTGQNWQSVLGNGSLFINRKGKILKANDLAVAKYEYKRYGLPNGYKAIDSILKEIKKL